MATKEYIFTGKAAFVSRKSKDFGDGEVWSMRLYPRTAADRKEIKATGIKNREQVDAGEGIQDGLIFFTLRNRDGGYAILDPQGNPVTELVGNGSEVAVKLVVETFNSPKYGPQARSSLKEVVVTNLVPYVPAVQGQAPSKDQELPA